MRDEVRRCKVLRSAPGTLHSFGHRLGPDVTKVTFGKSAFTHCLSTTSQHKNLRRKNLRSPDAIVADLAPLQVLGGSVASEVTKSAEPSTNNHGANSLL